MKLPIKLPQKMTRFLGKVLLKTKTASPEICVIGGIVCGGAALVMVGVNTWKHKDVLSKSYKDIQSVKEVEEGESVDKKALVKTRAAFAKELGKAYAVPTVLGVSSVLLVWGGRTMLRKELTAVTSAYALLMESYKKYRQRVIDDVGIEKDQEYMHGIKMVDAVDEETGEVTKKAIIDKDRSISPYAVWFNEGEWDPVLGQWLYRNYAWKDNPIMNRNTLVSVLNAANDQLRARGYLFLNEVLDMLGLPRTKAGQIVGWTLDGGDGYVSFGLPLTPSSKISMDMVLPVNKLFLEGKSASALLDFNVDGPILGVLDRAFGRDYADKLVKGV